MNEGERVPSACESCENAARFVSLPAEQLEADRPVWGKPPGQPVRAHRLKRNFRDLTCVVLCRCQEEVQP